MYAPVVKIGLCLLQVSLSFREWTAWLATAYLLLPPCSEDGTCRVLRRDICHNYNRTVHCHVGRLCRKEVYTGIEIITYKLFKLLVWQNRISGNFHDNLIFFFLAISFILQNIAYTKIISCIIFYEKHFKSQKLTDAN